MRTIIFALIIGLGIAIIPDMSGASTRTPSSKKVRKAGAAKKKVAAKKQKKISPAKAKDNKLYGELKTDVSFEDSVLNGQYQIPDEGLARVENEKVLSDVLGIRTHFKDRLLEASQQE